MHGDKYHISVLIGYFHHFPDAVPVVPHPYQTAEHPDDPINITDFQYSGPTPFSRETAVVMIVDSVEAACKSLKNHDKQSIDQLVDRIIDDKIRQNQLQNCDLSFGDITKIRKFLKSKMMSIYHSRISYPVANNK